MRQWYQQNVADTPLDSIGPGYLVLALIEPLHDQLVDVRRGQLLRRMVHNVLLVDLVEVRAIFWPLLLVVFEEAKVGNGRPIQGRKLLHL